MPFLENRGEFSHFTNHVISHDDIVAVSPHEIKYDEKLKPGFLESSVKHFRVYT